MPAYHTVATLLRASAAVSGLCLVAAMFSEAWRRSPASWLLALAVSHTFHLVFIIVRILTTGMWMVRYAMVLTAALGGAAYVFIYLMAWRRKTHPGLWWVWAIFFLGYAPKAIASPWRGAMALALLAAAVMRVVSSVRRRRLALQQSGVVAGR